jgi:hypothetical protein
VSRETAQSLENNIMETARVSSCPTTADQTAMVASASGVAIDNGSAGTVQIVAGEPGYFITPPS